MLLVGCINRPEVNVSVSAINNGSASIKPTDSCIIFPSTGLNSDDLQFKEFSKYVENALNLKNIKCTDNYKNASTVVFLSYGVDKPITETYTAFKPTFGQTGYSSSNTTGNIYTDGNNAYYSGQTTYTPTYGITGSIPYQESVILYPRWIVLEAWDLNEYRKNKTMALIWKTSISSIGISSDLRYIFPIMLAAATPYISENTKQNVNIIISEKNEKVLIIKGDSNKPIR